MAAVSPSILGVLLLQPMSGYDIEKFVATNMSYFWKESYGQIYPMLKRMAEQNLVEVRTEPAADGRLERQIYSITDAGREEVRRWLSEAPAEPSSRHELILKLFFGRHGDPADLIGHLQNTYERHASLRQRYEAIETSLRAGKSSHPDLPYWLLTLDYGKRYSQNIQDWAADAIATLRKLAPPNPEESSR